MQFVHPIQFEEALSRLGSRSVVGAALRSADWLSVPIWLRDRAFFSATIENVRFLQRAQDEITDYLGGARGTNERGESYLKTGGPWGFNSGCDVEDVDRDEAEELGLIASS